jgi:transposase-like protein
LIKFIEFPTDVVLLVVRWRLRCKLSLRDLRAVRAFFNEALEVTETTPDRVTTDGHVAYPRGLSAGPFPGRSETNSATMCCTVQILT